MSTYLSLFSSSSFLTVICVMLVICAVSGCSSASVWYVAPKGDDSGPGTAGQPWATIAQANARVGPGDTVILQPGEYRETIQPDRSGGSDEARITYQGSPEARITGVDVGFDLTDRAFITISGLSVEHVGNFGMMNGATNCRIEDCHLTGATGYPGIQLGLGERPAHHNVIRGCKMADVRGDGIQLKFLADHNLIEDNEIRFCDHGCIVLRGHGPGTGRNPSHNVVRRNHLSGRWHTTMNLDVNAEHNLVEWNTITGADASGPGLQFSACHNIVRRNLITGNYSMTYESHGALAVWAGWESGKDEICPAIGNRIYHNVIALNRHVGLSAIYWHCPECELRDNHYVNNIIYDNSRYRDSHSFYRKRNEGGSVQLQLTNTEHMRGERYEHNVFYSAASFPPEAAADVVLWDGELMTLAKAENHPRGFLSDNLSLDPKLVDPLWDDFRLRPDSPCLDAGRHLTATTSAGKGKRVPVA
ncbi:MAG: right-handed parallel beta-helix repeat-containing protein, partial [Armatimonadetes bacterium]|nr:right-handed parallel beta-helix repeat-containing protein [Armatimonadota bacterium]